MCVQITIVYYIVIIVLIIIVMTLVARLPAVHGTKCYVTISAGNRCVDNEFCIFISKHI